MYKFLLSQSDYNVNFLGLAALVTFFTIFVVAIVQIFFQSKKHIDHMSNLPMDDRSHKVLSVILLSMISAGSLMAQSTSAASNETMMDWAMDNIIPLLAGLVVIFVIALLLRLFNLLLKLSINQYDPKAFAEDAAPIQAESAVEEGSWWERLDRKFLTNAIPMDREHEVDLGHDYDGIRELDNSLPPWWLYGFYATIVFALGYGWWYHGSDNGVDQLGEYKMQMEEGEFIKLQNLEKASAQINESSVTLLTDASSLSDGATMFKNNCASCHLENGGGSVGPNLTDEFWIHGGGVKNIFKTIKYGVPEKGMIPWKDQMRPGDMQKLAAYIISLQGTKPAGGKAPQGEKYVETADSTSVIPAVDTIKVTK
jgi:cytochrome c oxidase cbb3-type subunit 3